MPSDANQKERDSKFMVQPIDFDLDIGVVNDIDFDFGFRGGDSTILADTSRDSSAPTYELDAECFLSLQGTSHGQALFIGRHKKIALPKEWTNPDFPFVRSFPNGDILISDTSFEMALAKSTWILNRTGEIKAHFAIGSAAVEILCLSTDSNESSSFNPDLDLIAVAYHPLSAKRFGHRIEPQQRTAIAFYDREGRMVSTFNHEASNYGISADNVRTMTRISPTEILFVPESAQIHGEKVLSPAIIFDARTKQTTVIPIPYNIPESASLCRSEDGTQWILLASPEGYEDQVIAFDPVQKMSHYLGAFVGIFRGLALGGWNAQPFWGGFLAQEFSSGYDWVLPEPGVLESNQNSSTELEPTPLEST